MTIADSRNIAVATIERIENLEIPQTPCPLVQPFPTLTPMPTNKPLSNTTDVLVDSSCKDIGPARDE